MNVLFLTLLDFNSLQESNIYTDLLREFVKNGHHVSCISPVEKKKNTDTQLIRGAGYQILKLKIGNIQKTNIIEKGISTLMIEPLFIKGIKKYFQKEKFDLILYSTPPITFCNAIEYVKKRDNAKTYLLLKDIFPQNAVDLGMMSQKGIKGILYRFFRNKEKKLYSISDYIGCMSLANVEYLLKHNPEIESHRVEVCPNSIEPIDMSLDDEHIFQIRSKYELPLNKKIFVYGGNLGKPQGIPFLIECLKTQVNNKDAFFLIIGDGTEYYQLEAFFQILKPTNMRLMKSLPKNDYDLLIASCDVGMIFLDHRFTIPNFPSRLLGYMQANLPVLACTDPNTDIGRVIVDGNFGWWVESKEVNDFSEKISDILVSDVMKYGQNAKKYLQYSYSVSNIFVNCFLPLMEKCENE